MSTRTEFNRSLYDSNGRNGNKAVSQVPAYVMGSMLVGSGIAHLVVPAKFDWMVPAELPGGQRFYTTASGVMEIATGAMILVPKARSVGALWAVAAALCTPVKPAIVRLGTPQFSGLSADAAAAG